MAKKDSIAAVLAMPVKGKVGAAADEGSEPTMSSSAKVDAAQALLDAVAGGNAEAVAAAFEDMLALCID